MDVPEPSREVERFHIHAEVLDILCAQWLLQGLRPDSEDQVENFRRLMLIRIVYDRVVLGLCKLAEPSKKVARSRL